MAHKARRVHLGACGDNLGLSNPLLLGGGGERLGDFGRENNVFDADFFGSANADAKRGVYDAQDSFDCNAPFLRAFVN